MASTSALRPKFSYIGPALIEMGGNKGNNHYIGCATVIPSLIFCLLPYGIINGWDNLTETIDIHPSEIKYDLE